MKISSWILLSALISCGFIAMPCHAENGMEQSLNNGVSYGVEGKFEQARQELEKALQVEAYKEPAKRALMLLADLKNGKIKPATTIFFFKGAEHILKNQEEDAIIQYSNAIKSDPLYAIAYDNRGLLYLNRGDFVKAAADFSRAIELDPDFADAYLNRGIAYALGTGQYVAAISDYAKAIELNPTDALGYNYRGYLYMVKMQEKEKACSDWKTACKLGDCSYYNQAKKSGHCN
jgi:tetratricopeptide (TPR) repeat protein